MNQVMLILTVAVIGFIGWLYIGEMGEVRSTEAAVTAAADNTAIALSQAPEPERNADADADADADGIFKKHIQASAVDDVSVMQNVQSLSPGRLRQSVKVSARARTKLSELLSMQGAEIEITATHDFDRKN